MPSPTMSGLAPQRAQPSLAQTGRLSGPSGLRPDLAAFFAFKSREYAPARLMIEHGILAELAAWRGVD